MPVSNSKQANIKTHLIQFSPVYVNRNRPLDDMKSSELLSLAYSSDVNNPNPLQYKRAQLALSLRTRAIENGWPKRENLFSTAYKAIAREILNTHIEARIAYYGHEQCMAFGNPQELVQQKRDIFLVIKFMDEMPHIASTINSLLNQAEVDLSRVVLVGVNNNSSDESAELFAQIQDAYAGPVKIVLLLQTIPGGGHAARFGVDSCLATIQKMCEVSGDWGLLHRARIAVSDGDTVYHPRLLSDATVTFDQIPDVDGVMPFLTYKLNACLRLFAEYRQEDPEVLSNIIKQNQYQPVNVPVSLKNILAMESMWRAHRKKTSQDGMAGMSIKFASGGRQFVPFAGQSPSGLHFGVMQDPQGKRAYILENRQILLESEPVSGYENVLIYQENGNVSRNEIWKWHSLIGHDLFLLGAFRQAKLARELILPDTSDALKSFRAWVFAVGGQHQLEKPGLKRVTGTDYQSGRVVQFFGGRTVLGSAEFHSETEIDRLAKMIRNFANGQGVFYGNTRGNSYERASGLYLHMTKIQGAIEEEIRRYPEDFYQHVVFPERLLFPLRWMLQNFISAYAAATSESDEQDVALQSFRLIFDDEKWRKIKRFYLSNERIRQLRNTTFESLRRKAEQYAEDIIRDYWQELLTFYTDTLRQFFTFHRMDPASYEFLLAPIIQCRNPLLEDRPTIDTASVWPSSLFEIDDRRGQVMAIIGAGNSFEGNVDDR